MKRINLRKKALMLISGVMISVIGLTSCGIGKGGDSGKEVTIRVPSGLVGTHPSAPYFAADVEAFNEKYKGKYKAVVEEIPGDANFAEKMNVMLTSGDVPDVIFPSTADYFEKSIKAGQVVALNEYLDADPEWKSTISEGGLEYNSRDGKVYAIPRDRGMLCYYYNKDLYKKAGIKPAETWDEFWDNCEKLKKADITPFALEPSWVGNIFFSAVLASAGEEGYALVNATEKPTKFNNPDMVYALGKLKDMYKKYSDEGAVVAKYENAANQFMNSRAAMVANGIWMTNDFADPNKAPKGFIDKVGVATFPGLVFSYNNRGIGIGAKTPEKIEAALAFVKFMTSPEKQAEYMDTVGEFADSPKVEISEKLMKNKPHMVELWNIYKNTEVKSNLIGNTWYPAVTEALQTAIPGFVSGSMSEQDVIKSMEAAAAKASK